MFAEPASNADEFEPNHADDRDAVDDLDLDPGECRRVDGAEPGLRAYHLRVGDLYLKITNCRVTTASPAGLHYDEAYGTTKTVAPGEAFAYLHGDHSTEATLECLRCGATHSDTSEKPCGCPVGSVPTEHDYPDVPTRAPRTVVDGELLTRPE